MKNLAWFWSILLPIICLGCGGSNDLESYGRHYQQHQDYASLKQVVEMIELGVDTARVRQLLGAPIDMGFDFRYTVDSVGPNGCVIGAVFHIDAAGKIDQKWIDEICE